MRFRLHNVILRLGMPNNQNLHLESATVLSAKQMVNGRLDRVMPVTSLSSGLLTVTRIELSVAGLRTTMTAPTTSTGEALGKRPPLGKCTVIHIDAKSRSRPSSRAGLCHGGSESFRDPTSIRHHFQSKHHIVEIIASQRRKAAAGQRKGK